MENKLPYRQKLAGDIAGLLSQKQHWWKLNQFILFVFFFLLLIFPVTTSGQLLYSDTVFNNWRLAERMMLWGLWFPLTLFSVLLLGRVWCGLACPMGAFSQFMNHYGPQKAIPPWLRWSGLPILSFIIVTILGQTLNVRNDALSMLILFGGIMLLAAVLGFFYGKGGDKRPWCRHACPIGLLLGVFSRLSIVEIRVKRQRGESDRYDQTGICPTLINLGFKRESRHCISCGRCTRPKNKGRLQFTFRALAHEVIHIERYNANLAETIFLFCCSGVALGGFIWLTQPSYLQFRQWLGEVFLDHGWFGLLDQGSRGLMQADTASGEAYTWLDFFSISLYMLGVMVLVASVMFVTTFLATRTVTKKPIGGRSMSFWRCFVELSYAFSPLAMFSILINLGSPLFYFFTRYGLTVHQVTLIQSSLIYFSVIFSGYCAWRLIARRTRGIHRYLALGWLMSGCAAIAGAWQLVLVN